MDSVNALFIIVRRLVAEATPTTSSTSNHPHRATEAVKGQDQLTVVSMSDVVSCSSFINYTPSVAHA